MATTATHSGSWRRRRSGSGSASARRPLERAPPPPPPQLYYLSYSATSGSIFASLRDHLLRLPWWRAVPEPKALERFAPQQLLSGVHLVLGDRYPMDRLIHDWREWVQQAGMQGARPPSRGEGGAFAPSSIVLLNYYSGSKELSLKSNMVRHLRAAERRPYDLTPVTYIIAPLLGAGAADERTRLRQCGESGVWIVKPARMNKAVGIRVMRGVDAILRYIDTHGERGQWVVQKYLERPFLISGRKFDIRTWVVVGPDFDIWMWREGVLRTSSEQFTLADLDNELSHLTNHCVQLRGPNYGRFEPTNEMWYSQFQAYLARYHPGVDFYRDAVPVMQAIVVRALHAVKPSLVHSTRSGKHQMLCYQVFGFDFMLDADFRVWLIEVNGQPAVAEDLLDRFTEDTVELLIHPLFPPPPGGAPPAGHRFELLHPGSTGLV